MSLFICMNCGLIENSNLINDVIYNDDYVKLKDYPNISIMDMHGSGEIDILFSKPYKYIKKSDEKLMLCCECNNGIHHHEFVKQKPTDLEKEYATYSKVNYITKYDHPIDISFLGIIIDKNRYDYFKERIFKLVAESEYMGIHKPDIYYDIDKDEIYDYHSRESNGVCDKKTWWVIPHMESLVDTIPVRKEKPKQSESEKQYMLTKAELKRLKRNRKKTLLNSPVNINIGVMDTEITKLENKLKSLKG